MRQIVRVERRMAIRDPTVPECSAPESNQGVHEGNTAAGQAMTTTQTERPELGRSGKRLRATLFADPWPSRRYDVCVPACSWRCGHRSASPAQLRHLVG